MTDTAITAPRTEDLPSFLDGFVRMHAAMRRDAARLPRAIAEAADRNGSAGLLRWFRCFRTTLEHHHQREDTIVFPELVRRDPSFGAVQTELVADHHVLDTALERVEAALAGDGDAAEAAEQLARILLDHLAREEAAAFPRLAAYLTADDWDTVERRFMKGTGLRELAFEVPWAIDGLPDDEIAALKAAAPLSLRVLYRLLFAPRYARVAAPLLEVA